MKRDPSLVRLSRDHQRGLALALRIDRELPAADGDRLASLLDEVVTYATASLLPHFRAECECLLARLLRHVAADDDLIVRTQRDHLSILALLTDLKDAGDGRERLAELAALLRSHIRWEESVLFEAAQSTLAATELSAVGADLAERLPVVPPPPPWLSGGARPTS